MYEKYFVIDCPSPKLPSGFLMKGRTILFSVVLYRFQLNRIVALTEILAFIYFFVNMSVIFNKYLVECVNVRSPCHHHYKENCDENTCM